MESIAIGIDLGTTNCCAAVLRNHDKKPEVIPNENGKNTTPSCVAYDEDGDIIVGETAKDLAMDNPENTVFNVKRILGRSFYDLNVKKYNQLWPFQLTNIQGLVGVKIGSAMLLPQAVAKDLLAHLKLIAENYLNCAINSAVITVPAYFNELQRGLTREACTNAGFENVEFISEPTAAAYAYGIQAKLQEESKTCLVFDLGGGTFDLTAFKVNRQKRLDIIGIGGDARLGGEDFNDVLVEYCIQQFHKQHGVDLSLGKTSEDSSIRLRTSKILRKIRKECEKQKCFLSSTTSVVISLECVYDDQMMFVPVTRALFEKLIAGHLNRCINTLDEFLSKYKISKEEIDDIVLIGGSSRIPKVQEEIERYFNGKKLHRSVDADEAVACGAAVCAYSYFSRKEVASALITVTDVEINTACYESVEKCAPDRASSDIMSVVVEQIQATSINVQEAEQHTKNKAGEIEMPSDTGIIAQQLEIIEGLIGDQTCNMELIKTWSSIWGATDDQTGHCERFVKERGVVLFLQCRSDFPKNFPLTYNMIGAVGNVCEVQKLRPSLMNSRFINEFHRLSDPDKNNREISYRSCRVLIEFLSDDPVLWTVKEPSRTEVEETVCKSFQQWKNMGSNSVYKSLIPLLRLLTITHTPICQVFAAWKLADVVKNDPDKYIPMLKKENGMSILKSFTSKAHEAVSYLQLVICRTNYFGSSSPKSKTDKKTILDKLKIIHRSASLIKFTTDTLAAWGSLWNINDENPTNCMEFLADNGLLLWLHSIKVFKNNWILYIYMLGTIGNIAEVKDLRPILMNTELICQLYDFLDITKQQNEIAYRSARILVELLSDGLVAWKIEKPSRSAVTNRIEKNVKTWNVIPNNSSYSSLLPILRLLSVNHTDACRLWAAWRLAMLISMEPNRYAPMLKEEISIENPLPHNDASKDVNDYLQVVNNHLSPSR